MVDTPRETQTRTAEDHLAALNWSRSKGRWPDVGTARTEGPEQWGVGGMANSGGRPMFRTERQELGQVSQCPVNSRFNSVDIMQIRKRNALLIVRHSITCSFNVTSCRLRKERDCLKSALKSLSASVCLTEDDIPGAKLSKGFPEECTCWMLRRWLHCRGGRTTGKKAALVQR